MEQKTFAEQIVERSNNASAVLKKLASALAFAVLLVIVASIPSLSQFLPVLCVGLALIAIAVVHSFNLEYEYTLSDGEFAVDVIYGRTRRKRKIGFSLSRVLSVVSADEAASSEFPEKNVHRFDFSSSPKARGRISVTYANQNELYVVTIEPNKKMYSAIVSSLPASVRMTLSKND